MGTEKLLTVEDAAKVLLVKSTTVRKWLKAGKLKGMKMGRLWRVWKSELEAFLQEDEGKSQISERTWKSFYERMRMKDFMEVNHEGRIAVDRGQEAGIRGKLKTKN